MPSALLRRLADVAERPAAAAGRFMAEDVPTAEGRRSRRLSADARAMLVIAAAVVLVHLPYAVGVFEADPLAPRSNLASATAPGPLGGEPTIDPNNGYISQALTHRAVQDWFDLRLPWWNPYQGTGAPLAGDMQSAALFPPSVLTLLRNGQLWERMLLEIVAGIATFLLLRRLAVSRWAALPAATAFALNGTFAWLAHAAINPVAFLPLLLLGIELAYTAAANGRRGGWWLIALAGALSFYAGFPEVAYLNALLAVAWLVWRVSCLERDRVSGLLLKASTGAIVGVLLAAPLLIPSLHFINGSDFARREGASLGNVHLPFTALPQLVLPYVYGPIFGTGDVSLELKIIWTRVGGFLPISLVLLAVVGLLSGGRRGLRLTLFAWIAVAVSLMYATPPLLTDLVGALPGMSRVHFYRFAFTSVEFAVIVLAALGLDAIIKSPRADRRVLAAVAMSLSAVALAVIGARPLAEEAGVAFGSRPYLVLAGLWGLGVIAALWAGTRPRAPDRRALVLGLVVAADVILMFAIPMLSAPREVRTDLAPVRYLQGHLGLSRYFSLGPIFPNYGSYFGIASLNSLDFPSKPFARYVDERLDRFVEPTVFVGTTDSRAPDVPSPRQEFLRNLAGYQAASVAYVLTRPGEALPPAFGLLTRVAQTPTAWIYRLKGSAPYFTASDPACTVRPQGRERVRLACPGEARLVRRESELPGWRAEIDGREVAIDREDGLFQAVTVPAGDHEVTFSYAPPHVRWGFAGFAAGVAWLLGAAVLTRHGRVARRDPASATDRVPTAPAP
jgi:hypothetical protein